MTAPTSPTPAARVVWYARPGIVLSLLGIVVLLSALFLKTPIAGREGDARLTTTSTAPLGAKLFYELAGKLGYNTRRAATFTVPSGGDTTFAVLDPTVALTGSEVHNILNHVRSGGGLLTVLGSGTRVLSDSLRIKVDNVGGQVESARQCSARTFSRTGPWLGRAQLFALTVPDSLRERQQTLIYVTGTSRQGTVAITRRPAMIGIPYGAGRIVIASDPDIFRNDALRNCQYGLDVAAVEALDYLQSGASTARRTLIFDEYHQNRQRSVGATSVLGTYLTRSPSGRTIFQICAAGIVLLLAAATRVLPPRLDSRLERRSPLEHVDALARAYAQVGATRTGVLRLVRGLQRRIGGGAKRLGKGNHEEEFLTRVAESKPVVAADVAAVKHALAKSVSPAEFREVGSALLRIEAALTQT